MIRTFTAVVAAGALAVVAAACSSTQRTASYQPPHEAAAPTPAPTQVVERVSPPAAPMPAKATIAAATPERSSTPAAETPTSTTSGNAGQEQVSHHARARLPKTASDRPLILLIGLSALAAAGTLRRATRG